MYAMLRNHKEVLSMSTRRCLLPVLLCLPAVAWGAAPELPGVGAAMQAAVDAREVPGAVTVVVRKDQVVHLQATGLADIAGKKPMQPDSLFWIASMTKPVTAAAVLMLQDEGKLHVADPVAKHVPAFADLKTPSGKPANLTIAQILTHTSGLGEAPAAGAREARTLADLVPLWLAAPMQFEPGARWQYSQSGINLAARIVEVVSGQAFDAFVQQRILDPLGMKHTTFYPAEGSVVTAYAKNVTTGDLEPTPARADYGVRGHPPLGNGGLYSTGPDYARFCQMLLGAGTLDGKRYLSPESMKLLTTVQTGDLPCGFLQSAEFGSRGASYGWGIGTCVLRARHDGVAAMLSPGTFGHGGAWGTQAWIDPIRGVAYVLMVQRSNFPNSDASNVRRAFQQAAADALARTAGRDFAPNVLFVEHTQEYQTIWNGNGGRVYLYQSEMPYDPPSQEAWRHGTVNGFASYKVADHVTTHEAWGLGVYCFLSRAPVIADNGIETATAPGIKLHHLVTIRLGGGRAGSGINHVINGTGDPVITSMKATVE